MFDVVKDINSELVIMDQFLSSKGSDLYMNICVNTEVVKSGNKENFRNYIFNSVNPKMRAYLTNGALTIDVKYEAASGATMSVKAEKWGTFIAPFDVTIPANINAYTEKK